MGRNKSLKNEILENEHTDARWKLIYFLCEDFGWEFVQVWGWLISVGELGITNSQFQKLLNIPPSTYKTLLTKIAKTGLVEKVRFVRQQKQTGVKLDWDELVDKYGSFARQALIQAYSRESQSENASQVVGDPSEILNSVECNSTLKRVKRPSNSWYAPTEFMIIRVVGDWTDEEIDTLRHNLNVIQGRLGGFKVVQDSDFDGLFEDDEKVGTGIATRVHALDRARAAVYISLYYIYINK